MEELVAAYGDLGEESEYLVATAASPPAEAISDLEPMTGGRDALFAVDVEFDDALADSPLHTSGGFTAPTSGKNDLTVTPHQSSNAYFIRDEPLPNKEVFIFMFRVASRYCGLHGSSRHRMSWATCVIHSLFDAYHYPILTTFFEARAAHKWVSIVRLWVDNVYQLLSPVPLSKRVVRGAGSDLHKTCHALLSCIQRAFNPAASMSVFGIDDLQDCLWTNHHLHLCITSHCCRYSRGNRKSDFSKARSLHQLTLGMANERVVHVKRKLSTMHDDSDFAVTISSESDDDGDDRSTVEAMAANLPVVNVNTNLSTMRAPLESAITVSSETSNDNEGDEQPIVKPVSSLPLRTRPAVTNTGRKRGRPRKRKEPESQLKNAGLSDPGRDDPCVGESTDYPPAKRARHTGAEQSDVVVKHEATLVHPPHRTLRLFYVDDTEDEDSDDQGDYTVEAHKSTDEKDTSVGDLISSAPVYSVDSVIESADHLEILLYVYGVLRGFVARALGLTFAIIFCKKNSNFPRLLAKCSEQETLAFTLRWIFNIELFAASIGLAGPVYTGFYYGASRRKLTPRFEKIMDFMESQFEGSIRNYDDQMSNTVKSTTFVPQCRLAAGDIHLCTSLDCCH